MYQRKLTNILVERELPLLIEGCLKVPAERVWAGDIFSVRVN
jgi:hypothetical protein